MGSGRSWVVEQHVVKVSVHGFGPAWCVRARAWRGRAGTTCSVLSGLKPLVMMTVVTVGAVVIMNHRC